jgi:hypothetical protein
MAHHLGSVIALLRGYSWCSGISFKASAVGSLLLFARVLGCATKLYFAVIQGFNHENSIWGYR